MQLRKLVKHLHLPITIKSPLYDQALQSFLNGRIWLEEELPFLKDVIRYHKTQKMIVYESGIKNKRCRRCDSKRLHSFECYKCQGLCSYCIDCLQMRRVSSCSQLVSWIGPQPEMPQIIALPSWQLTEDQQAVADRCLENERDFLIHAVTGAGKTEILFPIVATYIKGGSRVCIATPRTDVVLELLPRFQAAFPLQAVQGLYGGSDHSKKYSPLIITTTHQLLRFEHAFDVVIVDEADAFPYTYDKKLVQAVQKAKKKQGRFILMTATPDMATRKLYEKTGSYAFLAKRFHGAALPVPIYEALWRYKRQLKKGKIPPKLLSWLKRCLHNKQPFLIFFPSIQLMAEATPLFQQIEAKIEWVHAADQNRKKSVQALRDGQLAGLLTTTILERGITIPNVQVAVIGAEARLFTASALIQISGRVGRSSEATTGEIVFFHAGITWAMDEARSEIKRLNRLRTRMK